VGRLAHVLAAAGEHAARVAEEDLLGAALTTAWNPEPHSRFTVSAGVSMGRPAFRPTWRAP
jgi:hypothetical protein